MVSVDGEEPVSMYIQVPEKELEEQEEEPKQNKKLTEKNRHKKVLQRQYPGITSSAVIRIIIILQSFEWKKGKMGKSGRHFRNASDRTVSYCGNGNSCDERERRTGSASETV